MLVDAAVVMVENIVQRLGHDPTAGRVPRLHHLPSGLRSGGARYLGCILIIIIVFLPLLTPQDLEGKFFVPVALSIVCAGEFTAVVTTVIPVLASHLLHKVAHEEPWLPRKLCMSTTYFWLGT